MPRNDANFLRNIAATSFQDEEAADREALNALCAITDEYCAPAQTTLATAINTWSIAMAMLRLGHAVTDEPEAHLEA